MNKDIIGGRPSPRRVRQGGVVGLRGLTPANVVIVEAGAHWSGWARCGTRKKEGDLVTIAQVPGEPSGVFVARVRVALHRLESQGVRLSRATLVIGRRLGVEIVTTRLLLALAISLRFRNQRIGEIVVEGPEDGSAQRSVRALMEVIECEVEGTGVAVTEGLAEPQPLLDLEDAV